MLRSRLITGLLKAVFPDKCLGCGRLFHADTAPAAGPGHRHLTAVSGTGDKGDDRPVLAGILCPACLTQFQRVAPPFCTVCGMMFDSREGENHVCGQCLAAPLPFASARAAGVFDQSLMALVHSLKYRGRLQAARPLGRLLFLARVRYWPDRAFDLVVPVPLHPEKLRSRGFNQAWLLVRDWPDMVSAGMMPGDGDIDPDALQRIRPTRPQTGLGRKDRMTNIKNAFGLKRSSRVRGRRILLVDDVFTTGSTVGECARVLLRGGAAGVHVLTLARAM